MWRSIPAAVIRLATPSGRLVSLLEPGEVLHVLPAPGGGWYVLNLEGWRCAVYGSLADLASERLKGEVPSGSRLLIHLLEEGRRTRSWEVAAPRERRGAVEEGELPSLEILLAVRGALRPAVGVGEEVAALPAPGGWYLIDAGTGGYTVFPRLADAALWLLEWAAEGDPELGKPLRRAEGVVARARRGGRVISEEVVVLPPRPSLRRPGLLRGPVSLVRVRA